MLVVMLWMFLFFITHQVFHTVTKFYEYIGLLVLSFLQFAWLGLLIESRFTRFLRSLQSTPELIEEPLPLTAEKQVPEEKLQTVYDMILEEQYDPGYDY